MEVVHELAKVLQEQGEASKKEAVAQAPWKGIPEDELTGQRKTH
jgi:hypothetical protein